MNPNYQQISKEIQINVSKPLGQGGCAIVYSGTYSTPSGVIPVAVKQIKQTPENKQSIEKEIELLIKVNDENCPNIVNTLAISPTLNQIKANLNSQTVYIVMELCTCDLKEYLKNNQQREMLLNLQILKSIANGFTIIHKRGIIHRDLKPENIFVVKKHLQDDVFKVGDFGIGVEKNQAETTIGTLDFMAPEIMKMEPYTNKIDVWSYGVLAHWLFTDSYLFEAQDAYQIRQRVISFKSYIQEWEEVKKQIFVTNNKVKNGLKKIQNNLIAQFIDSLLNTNSELRPDFEMIIQQLDNFISIFTENKQMGNQITKSVKPAPLNQMLSTRIPIQSQNSMFNSSYEPSKSNQNNSNIQQEEQIQNLNQQISEMRKKIEQFQQDEQKMKQKEMNWEVKLKGIEEDHGHITKQQQQSKEQQKQQSFQNTKLTKERDEYKEQVATLEKEVTNLHSSQQKLLNDSRQKMEMKDNEIKKQQDSIFYLSQDKEYYISNEYQECILSNTPVKKLFNILFFKFLSIILCKKRKQKSESCFSD